MNQQQMDGIGAETLQNNSTKRPSSPNQALPHSSGNIAVDEQSNVNQTLPRKLSANQTPPTSDVGVNLNNQSKYRPAEMHEGILYAGTEPHLDQEVLENLKQQGFSTGLSLTLASSMKEFHHRLWVVDNSGSMLIGDGQRIVETADGQIVAQPVTRWEELTEAVIYHSNLAALLSSTTIFTLLNDPGEKVGGQRFSVAEDHGCNIDEDVRKVRTIMTRAKPEGVTPLTTHIRHIQESLRDLAPTLRRNGQRVAIVVATDGLPTDHLGNGGDDVLNEFVNTLRSLEGLPVWVVIRLCTDEKKVKDFYNSLDDHLVFSLEVIDDFLGEAKEVYRCNKWLNYALPLHRCRELGCHNRLFDFLDERPLTRGELRDFCVLLFGTRLETIPNPHSSWKPFVEYVKEQQAHEQEQYNPMKKKFGPWIDLKSMGKCFSKGFFKKK